MANYISDFINGEIKDTKNTNVVRLCGRIANRFDKKDVVILTISVMEYNGTQKEIYYPKVYFFLSDRTAVNEFMLGDEVTVLGHIAAPKKTRWNGERYVSQAIVGDLIRPRKRLKVPNAENDILEPQSNIIYLKGPLKDIRRINDKVFALTVEAVDHGHKSNVQLTSFDKNILLMDPGSLVEAYGSMRTQVKIVEGMKNKHYQNYVLRRISVSPEAQEEK